MMMLLLNKVQHPYKTSQLSKIFRKLHTTHKRIITERQQWVLCDLLKNVSRLKISPGRTPWKNTAQQISLSSGRATSARLVVARVSSDPVRYTVHVSYDAIATQGSHEWVIIFCYRARLEGPFKVIWLLIREYLVTRQSKGVAIYSSHNYFIDQCRPLSDIWSFQ